MSDEDDEDEDVEDVSEPSRICVRAKNNFSHLFQNNISNSR